MIFTPPLTWTGETIRDLQERARQAENLTLHWWWQPFHETGFRALRFAALRRLSAAELEKILENLSCPGVGGNSLSPDELGLLADENGILPPLDPERCIKATWRAAGSREGARLEDFAAEGLFMPTTRMLEGYLNGPSNDCPQKDRVPKASPVTWTPVLNGSADVEEMSTWLTKNGSLLKRFHDSDPWTRLECLENLMGVTKSSSNLHFQRVYSL